jgi:hypothetical protein
MRRQIMVASSRAFSRIRMSHETGTFQYAVLWMNLWPTHDLPLGVLTLQRLPARAGAASRVSAASPGAGSATAVPAPQGDDARDNEQNGKKESPQEPAVHGWRVLSDRAVTNDEHRPARSAGPSLNH